MHRVIRIAQDDVERRAQLMGHGRDKLRLEAAGLVEFLDHARAPTVFGLAGDLERMARFGDWTDSQTASAALEKEVDRLKAALLTFGSGDVSTCSDHPSPRG